FSGGRAGATMYRSWCAVQEGRVDEGLAALRAAFQDYTMSGTRISTTSYGTQLVEAYLAAGDVAAATATLDTALAFVAETGERLNEQDIHRLTGRGARARAQPGGKAEG